MLGKPRLVCCSVLAVKPHPSRMPYSSGSSPEPLLLFQTCPVSLDSIFLTRSSVAWRLPGWDQIAYQSPCQFSHFSLILSTQNVILPPPAQDSLLLLFLLLFLLFPHPSSTLYAPFRGHSRVCPPTRGSQGDHLHLLWALGFPSASLKHQHPRFCMADFFSPWYSSDA